MRQTHLIVMILFCLGLLSACGGGSSSSGSGGTAATADSVSPGATLPLGAAVSINKNGFYLLPIGATRITTLCTGEVEVTIEGSSNTNTCDSPSGSSNQTNVVSGASGVTYRFGPGASAVVTVA